VQGHVAWAQLRQMRGGQWLAFQLQGRGTEFTYSGPDLEWVASQLRGQHISVRYAPDGAVGDLLATAVEITRGQETIVPLDAGLKSYRRDQRWLVVMAVVILLFLVLAGIVFVMLAQGQVHPRGA
jgi:hypothetical protein